MDTATAIGAGIAFSAFCGAMEDDRERDLGTVYVPFERTPSPRARRLYEPAFRPQPSEPRRITRRPSWEMPLADYVDKCCRDIVGTEGSPGLNNHQANEQVFQLQQQVIRALEHPDEDGFIDDRQLRREAAALRSRYRDDVARLQDTHKR